MKKNVGTKDRVARILFGAGLLGAGYYAGSWFGLIGLWPIATALLGWCPMYVPFGTNTCEIKADGNGKQLLSLALLAGALFFMPTYAGAEWFFDTETGAAFSGYNDVRIPGDTGTKLSFVDDLKTDPVWFVRLRAGTTLADRHNIFLLAAPLTLYSEGTLEQNVVFDDATFMKGETVRGTYRFDSYRLTYRYDFVLTQPVTFGMGLTGKIRDAAISLDGQNFAEKPNTGFVPLVNLKLDWRFSPSWSLLFEADALAAPQGRAEDGLLAIAARVNDRVQLRAGYRILEGGADNDEVYTFALFHYAAFGLTATF